MPFFIGFNYFYLMFVLDCMFDYFIYVAHTLLLKEY